MSSNIDVNASTPSGRTYAGQSHADREAERRSAFLDAGLELIGTEGYRAATVRAVCKQAGYTDRYFYALFGSTEGLLAAVYAELAERLQQSMDAAIQSAPDTLEGRTRAGLMAYFRFMRDPRTARIMMGEVLGVSDAITSLYLQTVRGFAELLVLSAPELATVPDDDGHRLFGQSLVGAVIYAAGAWAMSGYRQPETQVIDSCQSLIIGALQRYADDRVGRTDR